MIWLYCLPGRLFASLGFLWPSKGDITGTARRRDSKLVHFVYASVFWGLLALYLTGSSGREGRVTQDSDAAATVEAAPAISADSAPEPEAQPETTSNPEPIQVPEASSEPAAVTDDAEADETAGDNTATADS